MNYNIRMGIPEMRNLWNDLQIKFRKGTLNKKSGAKRMFWVYGPEKKDITIIGLEPHPEDAKNGAYDRIKLSNLS